MAGLFENYAPLIKKFEGYTPRAVWDYKQNSNGYGTRARYLGEVIDRDTADQRVSSGLGGASQIVDRFAPDAPDGVKAALTSLTYNAGDKWTESGLGAAVRAGDWDGAKNRFVQYNRAGGSVNPGLVNRRNAEAKWFDGAPVMGLGGPPQTTQMEEPGEQMAGLFNLGAGLRKRTMPDQEAGLFGAPPLRLPAHARVRPVAVGQWAVINSYFVQCAGEVISQLRVVWAANAKCALIQIARRHCPAG